MMIPLWWMVTTSFKPKSEVFQFPPTFLPKTFQPRNYIDVFVKEPLFPIFIRNTLWVCAMDLIGTLLSCSMVGFAFARLRWRGRDLLFALTLATLMLPNAVTLIPRYLIFKNLNWLDTFKPLWVPSFFGYAFFIFLMRQFYTTLPYDLDDAARIDGCSIFGIWWRIALPLTKPAITACAIFTFNATWNDFMSPLLYLSSADKLTLAVGMTKFRGPHATDWHYLMAASVIAVAPVITIFFFAQRYFIQGVTFTGVKG
ncbi:MAG: carbohydrate ABC transporter permease [Chloroflexi bacterium]|nr:carbohydrate ABC transporter permease [Chloroflexota bacterium]